MSDPVYVYADWHRQATPELQLERLLLHIEEILPLMQGGKERDGRMYFPPKELWDSLQGEKIRLQSLVTPTAGTSTPPPFARVQLVSGRRLA